MNASMCAALSSNPRKLGHAGQHEVDACGQHDEGQEMGDHGFVSTKQKPSAAGRTWRLLALRRYPARGVSPFAATWKRNSPKLTPSLASEGHSSVFAGQTRQPYGSRWPQTAVQRSWMRAEHLAISLAAHQAIASTIPGGASN
jgi:hypothetical protein